MERQIKKAFIKKYPCGSYRQILCCEKELTLEIPKNKKPEDKEEIDRDTNWFNNLKHDKPLDDKTRTALEKKGFKIDQEYERIIESQEMTKKGIRK